MFDEEVGSAAAFEKTDRARVHIAGCEREEDMIA